MVLRKGQSKCFILPKHFHMNSLYHYSSYYCAIVIIVSSMNKRALKSVGVWKWPVTSVTGLWGRSAFRLEDQRSTHILKWGLVLRPPQLPSGLASLNTQMLLPLYYTQAETKAHTLVYAPESHRKTENNEGRKGGWKRGGNIKRQIMFNQSEEAIQDKSSTTHFILDSNSVPQLSCRLISRWLETLMFNSLAQIWLTLRVCLNKYTGSDYQMRHSCTPKKAGEQTKRGSGN